MSIGDSHVLVFLFVANAVMLAAAGIAVVRLQQLCRRLDPAGKSPSVAANASRKPDIERQQILLIQRLERRMAELQKYLHALAASERKSTPAAARPMPIDNAMRMARSGASIEELTRSCGLNIGEARLLQKLHSKSDSAASA